MIARDFKANSGKSLRDVVNRLEEGDRVVAENLKASLAMVEEDRAKITELMAMISEMNDKLNGGS